MKVHPGQRHSLGLLGIFEADVFKIDRAVLYFGHCMLRAGKAAFFCQYLYDSLSRFHGHGNHYKHHGKRHQAHQYLEAVSEDGGHLAHSNFCAPAAYHHIRAERKHKRHARINTELHHGVIEGHNALGAGEIPADILGCRRELLLFIVLAHIAFYHTHGLHVLLHGIVQRIVFAEHAAENRHRGADDQCQADAQQRNGDKEDHGQAPAHGKAHDKRENKHQRPADGDADDHHERHLHIHHVRSHTRNQA